MAIDIVLPEAGESVTTGVIASWVVKDGEWVDRDQTVAEVETDKITVEVPAPASGVLKALAAEGDEVDIGSVIGSIDETAPKPAAAPVASTSGADAGQRPMPPAPPAQPAPIPPSGGAATDPGASESTGAEPVTQAPVQDPAAVGPNGQARATPLARKAAAELGVDLARVSGTGAGERVREQDVVRFAGTSPVPPEPEATTTTAPALSSRQVRRQRMSPLRRRLAQRLVEAQQTAVMLTTFNECDLSAVIALRTRHKEAFKEAHGVGLGFMSFFVKAAASALRAVPDVNAFIVEDEDAKPAIEHHDYCDIAIAVASPKGLVVPVVRDCQSLSFAQIETTIKDFAVRAKAGRLALQEMQGGTFTITNGGVFGSLLSTPILNPPQSAILGMHAIKPRPVEDPSDPGRVVIRPMMYLAVSYDHRIVDGAQAVTFLVKIKEAIEDPQRLLLDL